MMKRPPLFDLKHPCTKSRIIKTQEKTIEVNSMSKIVSGFEELLRQTSYEILNEMSQEL